MVYLLFLLSFDISPMVNKANKLYDNEEYEKAYEIYKKASILYPDNNKIKFNLADCAYKLKRLREAADGFLRLTGVKDKDIKQKSTYNLGNTFMGAGQYREAVDSYKRALILKHDDERAKRNLEIAKKMIKEQKSQEDEEEDEKQEEKEQKQREEQPQSVIQQALESEQKKTMEKALKKKGGGRKEAGKW